MTRAVDREGLARVPLRPWYKGLAFDIDVADVRPIADRASLTLTDPLAQFGVEAQILAQDVIARALCVNDGF